MKILEEDIEQSKTNLNDAMRSAYRSMSKSDGLTYHALADIYRQLGNKSYSLPEICLNKQITWLLAEIEICLYNQDVNELNRAKSDIANALNSNVTLPDSFDEVIKEQWNGIKKRFQESPILKSDSILEEISDIDQLFDFL